MKNINIGLIGTGTVGKGVWDILLNNQANIANKTGLKLNLAQIYARDPQKAIQNGFLPAVVTNDYNEIINNPQIDVIIELLGGYEPAKTIVLKAIQAGKKVITANKALLAKHGDEIFAQAKLNNVPLGFEAAVGGSIPIIKILSESYIADNITSIHGILNGTTNYIITRMEEGMGYEQALTLAQEKGFAEADPTFDVEGYDAAQKILLLAQLAFNSPIKNDVPSMGITQLTKSDIDNASELGYNIKLLATAKLSNKQIDIKVKPTMIPKKHILANIKEELNAVVLKGEQTKESIFSGRGAGKLPTASVVVSDIINICQKKDGFNFHFFNNYAQKKEEEIESRFYLRFMVNDEPGVFAMLSKTLGDNHISISAVVQKELNTKEVPVIVNTHLALYRNIQKALDEIEKMPFVTEKPFYLTIEDF